MEKDTLATTGTPPVLSVGLPMFRARPIAWVALESLVRQKNPPPWELVIAEEKEPLAFGAEEIMSYWEGLKKANCVGIHYLSLDEWIPLSLKWGEIASFCFSDSIGFVLHAADNYSLPFRLNKTHTALQKGFSHVQWRTQVIYFLVDRKVVYQSHKDRSRTAGAMAYQMQLFRHIPKKTKASSVDGHLLGYIKKIVGDGYSRKEYDKCGEVSIRGINNISGRKNKKRILERSIEAGTQFNRAELLSYFPEDILKKVDKLKSVAEEWEVRPWEK